MNEVEPGQDQAKKVLLQIIPGLLIQRSAEMVPSVHGQSEGPTGSTKGCRGVNSVDMMLSSVAQ
jgi:hypothetical protein